LVPLKTTPVAVREGQPRAITLISAGSHREGWFQHQPGLDAAPLERDRRRSSIVLPLRSSDAGDGDIPIQQRIRPHLDDDRLLVDHDLLDERANDPHSLGERPSATAKRLARPSIFRTPSPGAPEMPNRSSNLAGLVSASTITLIMTRSIS
jgi:hypothetical protein